MINKFLDYFLPSLCMNCGYLGCVICPDCQNELGFFPNSRSIEHLKVFSSFYYTKDSCLSRLVYDFKYAHQSDLVRILGPPLARCFELFINDNPILVPVPLHKEREKFRGYNQSELLSQWLSEKFNLRIAKCIKRVKNTGQQAKTAHQSERHFNMIEAFELNYLPPKNSQIIIIDDIVTTGSTLIACANTLHEKSNYKISALTIANRENI